MTAYETVTLTQAMVHIIAGGDEHRRSAMAILDELRDVAEGSHSTWHFIRILTLQAVALHRQGRQAEALTALQQAILLGYPGRIVAVIVEGGAPVKRLLQRLAERGGEPAVYIRELLAACVPETAEVPPARPSQSPQAAFSGADLVDPLSPRELEVLALLSQRLSNKEIAERLVISPLTVKRHMTNILQKLGVDSRWDAVEQARKNGLIPPG